MFFLLCLGYSLSIFLFCFKWGLGIKRWTLSKHSETGERGEGSVLWSQRTQAGPGWLSAGIPHTAPLFSSRSDLDRVTRTPTTHLHLPKASETEWGPPTPPHLLHTVFSPSTKLPKEFVRRLKKINDQELQMKKAKKQGLELISPWTVKANCFQWVLTFLRIIKDLVVTFHKGPTTMQTSSTCFPHTMCGNAQRRIIPCANGRSLARSVMFLKNFSYLCTVI